MSESGQIFRNLVPREYRPEFFVVLNPYQRENDNERDTWTC